jgi:NAD+ kinase
MAKRAILFINLHKAEARTLASAISAQLSDWGLEVTPLPLTDKAAALATGASAAPTVASAAPTPLSAYDVAFSLGGDGTVLYTARAMAPLGTPIFAIHLGTLGFIAAVRPDEWATVFRQWLAGEAVVSRRLMLDVRVERDNNIVAQGTCLNEAVIATSGIAKVIRLRVEAGVRASPDGGGASSGVIRLGEYRADGLIIATPTGSTAYSAAAGGPILDPEVEALIVNPVCPFTLSGRPLVAPAWETIMVEVAPNQRSSVRLTLDGQVTEALEAGDRVYVSQAPFQAALIASDRNVFYRALHSKLAWGAPQEGVCLRN